ncbi:MAG: undecaprenyl-diphosphatase UppP, partial [Anaerolineae bacterium]|nr:undecaprenyl-diphosphatase UppP [Anaerolineae bacterium]
MSPFQAIFLGFLQGATEFLPVSSSGHLVILPHLLNWTDPGLAFDAVLHLGTLLAVFIYFWSDVVMMIQAFFRSLRNHSLTDPEARITWGVIIGSIPAALAGFLLEDIFEQLFGMPRAAAGFLLVTAALLLISEYVGKRLRDLEGMTWQDALFIGVGQALAIVPGLSRSGSTISAAMLLGYRREAAARFSFLLSMPVILGSGLYQLLKLATGEVAPIP